MKHKTAVFTLAVLLACTPAPKSTPLGFARVDTVVITQTDTVYNPCDTLVPPPIPPDTNFRQLFPSFSGQQLPIINSCAVANIYGMCAWTNQILTLATAVDTTGTFMRVAYPGRESPFVPQIWPAPDFGGRSPSRWMLSKFDSVYKGVEVSTNIRTSCNWSQRGAKPPQFTEKAWNVGSKFFFPRTNGTNDNSYIALWGTEDKPNGRVENYDFRFQLQGYSFAGCYGGLVDTLVAKRGPWVRYKASFKFHNDSIIHSSTVNGVPYITNCKLPAPPNSTGFAYIWADPTFGGGVNIPWDNQYWDMTQWEVRVRN